MTRRAAIYCRISRDAEQEGLGVARQEEDCRALVAAEGWELLEPPYVDNDISASTLSRKGRPAFDAMLAAVREGRVDVIVAYSNSRFTRRPLELEDLIVLHEQTGVTLRTVVSGDDDLSQPSGRMVARIKASVDAHEAEVTAQRLRRAFLAKAQAGATNQGARPFGWADDKVSPHPEEAALVRDAAADVTAGVPTREVARRWNEAGVTTTRGGAWNHTSVRALLRSPRLAGWRVHGFQCGGCDFAGDGGALSRHQRQTGHPGRERRVARDASGAPVRGVWEPLLGQDAFDALQVALDGRATRSRRGAQRYLLSGVVRCGECGGRMHGTKVGDGRHAYACNDEHRDHTLTVAGLQTDALVSALVQGHLARVGFSGEDDRPATWAGEARLAQIPRLVRELMDGYKAGAVPAAVAFPAVKELEAEQVTLEKERPRAAPRPVRVDAEDFAALDVDRARAVVESVVESVVVARAARRGAPWTADRLEVVWR